MSEKIYNTMKSVGGANIATGIIVLVTGITTGILMIVHGARLLKCKKHILL